MIEALHNLIKLGEQVQVQSAQRSRSMFTGIPSHNRQRNWKYSIVEGKDGNRHMRLNDGSRSINFRLPKELKDNTAFSVVRTADSDDSAEELSSGVAQVHRSGQDEIHATIQDGRRNATMTFSKDKDDGEGELWNVSVKPPKPNLAQKAIGFVEKVKQAPVDSGSKLAKLAAALPMNKEASPAVRRILELAKKSPEVAKKLFKQVEQHNYDSSVREFISSGGALQKQTDSFWSRVAEKALDRAKELNLPMPRAKGFELAKDELGLRWGVDDTLPMVLRKYPSLTRQVIAPNHIPASRPIGLADMMKPMSGTAATGGPESFAQWAAKNKQIRRGEEFREKLYKWKSRDPVSHILAQYRTPETARDLVFTPHLATMNEDKRILARDSAASRVADSALGWRRDQPFYETIISKHNAATDRLHAKYYVEAAEGAPGAINVKDLPVDPSQFVYKGSQKAKDIREANRLKSDDGYFFSAYPDVSARYANTGDWVKPFDLREWLKSRHAASAERRKLDPIMIPANEYYYGDLSKYTEARHKPTNLFGRVMNWFKGTKTAGLRYDDLAIPFEDNGLKGWGSAAALGAGVGALANLLQRGKSLLTGEEYEGPSLARSLAVGGGMGLVGKGGYGLLSALSGQPVKPGPVTQEALDKSLDNTEKKILYGRLSHKPTDGLADKIISTGKDYMQKNNSLSVDAIIRSIESDGRLSHYDRQRLIDQVLAASRRGISFSPEQLVSMGFGALAAWLGSRMMGFGAFGSTIAAAAGAGLGSYFAAPPRGATVQRGSYYY